MYLVKRNNYQEENMIMMTVRDFKAMLSPHSPTAILVSNLKSDDVYMVFNAIEYNADANMVHVEASWESEAVSDMLTVQNLLERLTDIPDTVKVATNFCVSNELGAYAGIGEAAYIKYKTKIIKNLT
jgi:hypothetical protein